MIDAGGVPELIGGDIDDGLSPPRPFPLCAIDEGEWIVGALVCVEGPEDMPAPKGKPIPPIGAGFGGLYTGGDCVCDGANEPKSPERSSGPEDAATLVAAPEPSSKSIRERRSFLAPPDESSAGIGFVAVA